MQNGPGSGAVEVAVVRVKGVEPSRGCPHMDLNHARLPFRHTRVTRVGLVSPGQVADKQAVARQSASPYGYPFSHSSSHFFLSVPHLYPAIPPSVRTTR